MTELDDGGGINQATLYTLSSRLAGVEDELSGNFRKLNEQMDQLLAVAQDVSLLQHQYTVQAEVISEVRASLKEQSTRIEQVANKINQRFNESIDKFITNVDNEIANINDHMSEHEKWQKNLERTFYMWLNRGIGGWCAIVVIVAALQLVGIHWLEGLEKERVVITERVERLSTRIAELERIQGGVYVPEK